MISFKEYANQLCRTPLNYCFSLIGGLILIDTDYIEKLVRFNNGSLHCLLAATLFEKNSHADLVITHSCIQEMSVVDICDLIFILAQLFSSEMDRKNSLQNLAQWFDNKQHLSPTIIDQLYMLIKTIIDTYSYINTNSILILYILQSFIYKKINTAEECNNYYSYVSKYIVSDDFKFDLSLQQALLDHILEKHYPENIPRLCYTRLAYLDNYQTIFPDCCVTSIRNIINTLLYDGNKKSFDLSLLEHVDLNIHKAIIDYYQETHSLEQIQLQSIHNKWAYTTQGLNQYDRSIQYSTPVENPYCELKAGAANMMKVFGVLFSTSDINKIIWAFNQVRKNRISIDSRHLCLDSLEHPDYENKIIICSGNAKLEWYFLKQHFRCSIFRNDLEQKNNISALMKSDALIWLRMLLFNQELPASAIDWHKQCPDDGFILYFMTSCLRSPENLFSAVSLLLDKQDSLHDEQMIKTIVNFFDAIPNDPFHLYNKYVLMEKAQHVAANVARNMNIDENKIGYAQ